MDMKKAKILNLIMGHLFNMQLKNLKINMKQMKL